MQNNYEIIIREFTMYKKN